VVDVGGGGLWWVVLVWCGIEMMIQECVYMYFVYLCMYVPSYYKTNRTGINI
jgi:hypothetical protein